MTRLVHFYHQVVRGRDKKLEISRLIVARLKQLKDETTAVVDLRQVILDVTDPLRQKGPIRAFSQSLLRRGSVVSGGG